MILKRNRPQNNWVDKVTGFAGAFEKFCAAEGIQVYSTTSETKVAFVERTIRSLKIIVYNYLEDFGYNYIHKLPQFISTLNCRPNSSIDTRPNTVKNFFCLFFTLNFYENIRNLYSKLVIECESQCNTCLFAEVTSHSLQAKVLKFWQLQQESHHNTQSRMSKTRLFKGNSTKKSWIKSFNKGVVYNRVGF